MAPARALLLVVAVALAVGAVCLLYNSIVWHSEAPVYHPLSVALSGDSGSLPSHPPSTTTLAVCTRLRNEGHYLAEWLEFHLLVGVQHFYIFDDASTDDSQAILQPYVAKGLATVWPVLDHKHDSDHGQFGHRDECMGTKNVKNATWVAMIDADEFLFPIQGASLKDHLLAHCPPELAFLMIRWQMFGSNGLLRRPKGSVVDHYRTHFMVDSRDCPAGQMGCFFQDPPLSTKLIVNTRCVERQGTHYATKLSDDPACLNIYAPLQSKETYVVPGAKQVQEECVLPIQLNHYAVKSREDYLQKFQRGRISRGDQDIKEGLATRNASTGQVQLKPLPPAAVHSFLTEESPSPAVRASLSKVDQTLLDMAVFEFDRRDFSEARNEGILRFLPLLRLRLPSLFPPNTGGPRILSSPLFTLDPLLPPAPDAVAGACLSTEENKRDPLRQYATPTISPSVLASFLDKPHSPNAHHPLVHIHIPKTAGTTLNLHLLAASKLEGFRYCEVRTSYAHRRRPSVRGCSVVSGEFDFSITKDLAPLASPKPSFLPHPTPRDLQFMTFLRDPIARTTSQFEHHMAKSRFNTKSLVEQIGRLASPALCHQLQRKQTQQCEGLSNPLKCKGNGLCGIFQDHQAEVLAGAMSLKPRKVQKLRRSRDQLLCSSYRHMEMMQFVGITEHYHASMCLFFHTFKLRRAFSSCCTSPPTPANRDQHHRPVCRLLRHSAKKNSAADRKAGNYLSTYTSDPNAMAALYEGNIVDCELYHRAYLLFIGRLHAMEIEAKLPQGSFAGPVRQHLDEIGHASKLCLEAKKASDQQLLGMGFVLPGSDRPAPMNSTTGSLVARWQRVLRHYH